MTINHITHDNTTNDTIHLPRSAGSFMNLGSSLSQIWRNCSSNVLFVVFDGRPSSVNRHETTGEISHSTQTT